VAAKARPSQLRIIGGAWRGRRIHFPDRPGLRPTPDRVRETLFNWLQPGIAGARCLDLFAGSGALGLEALSRGAGEVVFVEADPVIAQALQANVQLLHAEGGRVENVDALAFLARTAIAFDVVFLDPPFQSGLLRDCIPRLAASEWIKPGGLIYIEAQKRDTPELPPTWGVLRHKTAGQVGYYLARENRP